MDGVVKAPAHESESATCIHQVHREEHKTEQFLRRVFRFEYPLFVIVAQRAKIQGNGRRKVLQEQPGHDRTGARTGHMHARTEQRMDNYIWGRNSTACVQEEYLHVYLQQQNKAGIGIQTSKSTIVFHCHSGGYGRPMKNLDSLWPHALNFVARKAQIPFDGFSYPSS